MSAKPLATFNHTDPHGLPNFIAEVSRQLAAFDRRHLRMAINAQRADGVAVTYHCDISTEDGFIKSTIPTPTDNAALLAEQFREAMPTDKQGGATASLCAFLNVHDSRKKGLTLLGFQIFDMQPELGLTA